MKDKRSMQYAKPGDDDALDEISGQAFVLMFDNVVRQAYGPVPVADVISTLRYGEAHFIDDLDRLGSTQEAVLEALEQLVIKIGIRVFVLNQRRVYEVTPDTVRLTQAFRRLDVILRKGAA